MVEKTLATFKICPNQWELFKAKCAEQDTNATKAILKLIGAFLDGRLSLDSTAQRFDIELIDDRVEAAISPFLAEVEAMRADIKALKSDRSLSPKYPSQNDLQQTLDHNPVRSCIHQKASNMPLESTVVKPLLGMGDAVCSHCGSTELVRKGKSASVDKNDFSGRRVKCKSCGMGSTLWEAK